MQVHWIGSSALRQRRDACTHRYGGGAQQPKEGRDVAKHKRWDRAEVLDHTVVGCLGLLLARAQNIFKTTSDESS
mgnify:CR=1 FL=1